MCWKPGEVWVIVSFASISNTGHQGTTTVTFLSDLKGMQNVNCFYKELPEEASIEEFMTVGSYPKGFEQFKSNVIFEIC